MEARLRKIYILLLIFSNAVADQLTKSIARKRLDYNVVVEVIGKKLFFIKVENRGAFLSTGDMLSAPVKFLFLTVLPLAALFYGMYIMVTRRGLPVWLVAGVCFVIGGGLGNLADRLLYGSVTDFMVIDFAFLKTGVFNVGDVSIAIGMVFILISSYLRRKGHPQQFTAQF